jgi:N-hydroxyarylamine O-acetyltransferase
VNPALAHRYLRRLGFGSWPAPTLETLFHLHRRHVERVAYENLDIQLGRATTVWPAESAERIAAGRGGYCFHLNGAFAALLDTLGYRVTVHRGQVKKTPDPPGGVTFANHLALTVECEGREWFVDVGLGDGIHTPVPLRSGGFRQGPFRYALRATPDGWRFVHDRRGSFTAMDFESAPAGIDEFSDAHRILSTGPNSTFVRHFIVMRRTADRLDRLHGVKLSSIDRHGERSRRLHGEPEWRAVLERVFHLRLADLPDDGVSALWHHHNGLDNGFDKEREHATSLMVRRGWNA